MTEPRVEIEITASDRTARGARSAERRVGQSARRAGSVSRDASAETERRVAGAGNRMARTFGRVEQAAARALGGTSITDGITSRIGGITEAASALGGGLGEASAAGGLLGGMLGTVGVAAAGTVGVLAAAAWAAFKLADGWARGANSIRETAETIGVGTKAMQEFGLVAERVGVDRGTATGAVGGLSQVLNDAKYGRNNDALALLGKLGVKLQTNDDGTVNIEAMLPAIADAIARQNSSGRRTAARILGIPQAALPVFTQGGKSLSADMVDTEKRGAVIDDGALGTAKDIVRRDTIGAQLVERVTNAGKQAVATGVQTVGDVVISGARQFFGAVKDEFVPAARENREAAQTTRRAADTIDRAATRLSNAASGALSTTSAVVDAVRRAGARAGGDAQALLGIAAHESSLNPEAKAKGTSATGLFQFLDDTWLSIVKKHGDKYDLGWASNAIRSGDAGRGSPLRERILNLRTDPYVNSLMGAELYKDNSAAIAPVLGRQPTVGENYMAHFLGAGGARRFFTAERAHPDASAADAFPTEARANRSVFFEHGRELSLRQVADKMARFVERPINVVVGRQPAAAQHQPPAPNGHTPAQAQDHPLFREALAREPHPFVRAEPAHKRAPHVERVPAASPQEHPTAAEHAPVTSSRDRAHAEHAPPAFPREPHAPLPSPQPAPAAEVLVRVEHVGAPAGTRTTVRHGRPGAPAVSHALHHDTYQPAHGG